MDWQPRNDKKADRYFGLAAWQFDIVALGAIVGVLIAVWLVVFNADDFGAFGTTQADTPAASDSIVAQASTPTPEPSSPPTATAAPSVGWPATAAPLAPTAAPTAQPEPEPTLLPPVTQSPTPGPAPLVVQQTVAASAAKFQAAVHSFRGTFDVETRVDDFRVGMTGEMLFEAPGSMYMVMEAFGDKVEILLDAPEMYMNLPGVGWRTVTQDIPGFDSDAYSEYLDNRGIVDYSQQMGALDNLERLPDEEINGVAYQHYAGDLDLESILAELPDEFVDDPQIDEALNLLGDILMEVWLDPDTLLPRRYITTMAIEIDGQAIVVAMSMDFLEYNQPVNIPPPPVGAPPLLPPEFV